MLLFDVLLYILSILLFMKLTFQTYLRGWSREFDCPIFSVDYSLAPEAPFPRALDECVFAYSWALNNLNTLGEVKKRLYA